MNQLARSQSADWRPLLSGEEAESALEAVDGIARDLRACVAGGGLAELYGPPGRGHSLAGGEAGIAVFFAYLERSRPGEGYGDLAMELLDAAVAGTDEMELSGLYSGFTGIAWALEHLQGRLFESEDGEDLGETAAEGLREILGQTPWELHYDLISGLAGHGLYALERGLRSGGRECVARVVAHFASLAEHRPEGIVWRTPQELASRWSRKRYPEGAYNLGVAHGVPGVIPVLAAAVAAGASAARPLLEKGVSWMLSQKLPPNSASIFPYSVAPGRPPDAARLAWCYGDAGIAAALQAAGRAVGEPAWEEEALEVARGAAARPPDQARILDACLCHGAAGLAHLFNRLHQAGSDPELGEAARFWFLRALAMRRPGQGIGGFQTWNQGEDGELRWQDEPGFLIGSAGVGLALLAAATPVEPEWDRLLLASLPGSPLS